MTNSWTANRSAEQREQLGQKILCVEDDAVACLTIVAILDDAGYQVTIAKTGARARALMSEDFDLVLLDLNLPDVQGFTLLRELRRNRSVPIIVLTGDVEHSNKVAGLEMGADDYITKPFDRHEMVARVRSILRRVDLDRPERRTTVLGSMTFEGWVLCQRRRTLHAPDKSPVRLTTKEFDLLCLLARNSGKVLSRDFLMHSMAGITWDAMGRRVDVLISRMRKKLTKANPSARVLIKTIRGAGYEFVAKVAFSDAQSPAENLASKPERIHPPLRTGIIPP